MTEKLLLGFCWLCVLFAVGCLAMGVVALFQPSCAERGGQLVEGPTIWMPMQMDKSSTIMIPYPSYTCVGATR